MSVLQHAPHVYLLVYWPRTIPQKTVQNIGMRDQGRVPQYSLTSL